MPPAVWIFCDYPVGKAFGASYMAESWARELGELGWDTRLVSPSGSFSERSRTDDELTFSTIPNVGYRGDHYGRYSMIGELWRARKNRPDVILVTTPLRVGALGIALATAYNIPTVAAVSTDITTWAKHNSSIRVSVPSVPKFALLLAMSRGLRRQFFRPSRQPDARSRSFSSATASKLVEALHDQASELIVLGQRPDQAPYVPADGQQLTVFPSGVDRLPEPTNPITVPWREGALRALYVGRLSHEKTPELVVEGVALARSRGLDVQLAMVGDGHLGDELRAQAKRRGLDDTWIAGPFPRADLRSVYASADLLAFPSRFDTQGFVVNEAAHEGLPLLVADDVNPVVVDGVSAVCVEHSAEGFADGLLRLNDPELRATLGAGAREQAARYTESGQIRKLSAVLTRAQLKASLPAFGRPAAVEAEQLTLPAATPSERSEQQLQASAPSPVPSAPRE